MAVNLVGQDKVLANLNKLIKDIKIRKTPQSVASALIYIRGKAVPLTPIDTSNLRGSFYTKLIKTGRQKVAGEIGNTANYAVHVHENLDSHHDIGEAKFLEKAIVDNIPQILNIIKRKLTL